MSGAQPLRQGIYTLAVGGEGEWDHGPSRIPTLPLKTRGGGTADVLGQDSASLNARDKFRACVYMGGHRDRSKPLKWTG